MDGRNDIAVALASFVEVMDRLRVTWYVGGSVASTVHGRFRATNNVDVVANIRAEHAPQISRALTADHYVDEKSIVDAVRRHASFNLIHFGTGLKIDVFVPSGSDHAASASRRRVSTPFGDGPASRQLWVASAEDVVLAKLEWYRRGGEVSERQWRDVQGVLELRRTELDLEYLRRWAATLKVDDLFERALTQAATPSD